MPPMLDSLIRQYQNCQPPIKPHADLHHRCKRCRRGLDYRRRNAGNQ